MKIEIEYKGKKFTIRSVTHRLGGLVNIGSISLQRSIMVDDEYQDRIAQRIDEQIYGYVDDAIIENLSDNEFKKYVNQYFD